MVGQHPSIDDGGRFTSYLEEDARLVEDDAPKRKRYRLSAMAARLRADLALMASAFQPHTSSADPLGDEWLALVFPFFCKRFGIRISFWRREPPTRWLLAQPNIPPRQQAEKEFLEPLSTGGL